MAFKRVIIRRVGPLFWLLDLKAMNTPYKNPTLQLAERRGLFRLTFGAVMLVAVIFVVCIVSSFFFPIDPVLNFIFPGLGKSSMQPGLKAAVFLGTLILILWLTVYFVVTRVSNGFVLGILAGSTFSWLSLLALVIAMDADSPGGRSDINVSAVNCSIGFFVGSFAAMAVARYLRRSTAI
jgi:hypothetical protein